MQVLHVHSHDVGGGAARVAADLIEQTNRRGHQAVLAVGSKFTGQATVRRIPKYDPGSPWPWFWSKIGHGLDRRRLRGAARAHRIAALGSRYWWTERRKGIEDFHSAGTHNLLELFPIRPDVVHAHNLHNAYFDLRFLPELCTRAPVLLTLHDQWLFTGHCAHSFECDRWKSACGSCPHLDVHPAILRDASAENLSFKREIFARSRFYVSAPSHWLLDRAMASVLAPGVCEARVIPNSVDPRIFHPGDKSEIRRLLGISTEALVLLFVGQNATSNRWKDFATIQSAVEKVVPRLAPTPIIFICIGGEERIEVQGRTTFRYVSYLSHQIDLARYYQAADVYLHAAHVNAETFGTVIIEALACGTPVIATAVGGIPELVEDGVTGFLVPAHAPEAMAARIVDMCGSVERRRDMGRAAAATVSMKFGLERMVDAFEDYYSHMLASRESGAGASA